MARMGDWVRPRLQDWAMRWLDELRPETVGRAEGEVLEVGFGTGLNLAHYGPEVTGVVGVDPNPVEGFGRLEGRLARARFRVEVSALRADRPLPFAAGRFDTVVSTWTLCSIPDPHAALAELRRVLRPGGHFLFVEHGRAPHERTARWQDRLDPIWTRFADGCHMNRPIDALVEASGFRLVALDRFRHSGPGLLAHMYRGTAEPA